jgi:hypothetical protein
VCVCGAVPHRGATGWGGVQMLPAMLGLFWFADSPTLHSWGLTYSSCYQGMQSIPVRCCMLWCADVFLVPFVSLQHPWTVITSPAAHQQPTWDQPLLVLNLNSHSARVAQKPCREIIGGAISACHLHSGLMSRPFVLTVTSIT